MNLYPVDYFFIGGFCLLPLELAEAVVEALMSNGCFIA